MFDLLPLIYVSVSLDLHFCLQKFKDITVQAHLAILMPKFMPYRSKFNVSTLQVNATMKDHSEYDALRNVDGHSESSTEVEEWDPENEVRSRRRRTGVWGIVRRYRWMIDTALLLVIFGLLAEKRWKKHTQQRSHRFEFTGDLTGFAPRFSQQIVTFKPDNRFAPKNVSAFWDLETQNAWLSIVPKGLGYVLVKNQTKYDNLPTPIINYPNQTVFTTSMTHQLHCLYSILDAYSTLYTAAFSPGFSNPIEPWHMNHCFDYLRQSIMCAGDVALEGAETTFPPDPETGERGGSDGWDAKHVCKDYGQILDHLERETIGEEKWI
ncbi:uncharacterized protein BDR25DRAFT_302137 [Lindgomyces ingoldianus]|uniref:Uncharacterized protein n=1 Tax=Lindgomyces ingoldianus TaxID=673940 RepID=A0ACB6R498_9PLEO|nr:uncharacterized protein BDR25DRAFT_302137 [Lindgomyces ingoldianus]KAF2473135.1 hypothetical protein BDR25DRAFT_302137 [Lindgomyces ingoldianus]